MWYNYKSIWIEIEDILWTHFLHSRIRLTVYKYILFHTIIVLTFYFKVNSATINTYTVLLAVCIIVHFCEWNMYRKLLKMWMFIVYCYKSEWTYRLHANFHLIYVYRYCTCYHLTERSVIPLIYNWTILTYIGH